MCLQYRLLSHTSASTTRVRGFYSKTYFSAFFCLSEERTNPLTACLFSFLLTLVPHKGLS